jgi:hypothetical protein
VTPDGCGIWELVDDESDLDEEADLILYLDHLLLQSNLLLKLDLDVVVDSDPSTHAFAIQIIFFAIGQLDLANVISVNLKTVFEAVELLSQTMMKYRNFQFLGSTSKDAS